jgi:hypothetical protein
MSATYMPCSVVGFSPKPPKPPGWGWGLLLMLLVIAMLLGMIWFVDDVTKDLDINGSCPGESCLDNR